MTDARKDGDAYTPTQAISDLYSLADQALKLAWELNAELLRFCEDPLHQEHRETIEEIRDALDVVKARATDDGTHYSLAEVKERFGL